MSCWGRTNIHVTSYWNTFILSIFIVYHILRLDFWYEWDPSKFTGEIHRPVKPQGYWDDINNQRAFLDHLSHTLHIHDTKGWSKLTVHTFKQNGGASLLAKYNGSLCKLLVTVFPEYKLFCRESVMQMARQWKLGTLQELLTLPNEKLHINGTSVPNGNVRMIISIIM